MSDHYILLGGEHGCLPDYCAAFKTYADAVNDAAQLYELGRRRVRELRASGNLELNPGRDGASYCEIVSCDCDKPWTHSEMDSEDNWRDE